MRSVLIVLAALSLSACSVLTNAGLLSPDDLASACATVKTVCAEPTADKNVTQACNILSVACTAAPTTPVTPTPVTTTTLAPIIEKLG